MSNSTQPQQSTSRQPHTMVTPTWTSYQTQVLISVLQGPYSSEPLAKTLTILPTTKSCQWHYPPPHWKDTQSHLLPTGQESQERRTHISFSIRHRYILGHCTSSWYFTNVLLKATRQHQHLPNSSTTFHTHCGRGHGRVPTGFRWPGPHHAWGAVPHISHKRSQAILCHCTTHNPIRLPRQAPTRN